MSIRALHHTKAVKQIEAAASIVALAELEAEELAGGEHRQSVAAAFSKAAEAFVSAGITEDERVEAGLHLEGKAGSIILAALEGDSHSDDGTGPVETREGGESPSEAADPAGSVVEASTQGCALLTGNGAHSRGRVLGALVRSRRPDGTVSVGGLSEHRRRRG